jgi:crotonobetainyl-CoA:carnitine CoA-transferase CaiB-like acyl-CoA transferase
MNKPSTALDDVTVLDLTRVRAGPTCVRQLADWGAKVIKIEMPEEGGSSTQTDFSARHEADFQNLHRNKRSMTLNLKSPDGLEVLRRMVTQADVIVENYRPDVKTRLGIGYDALDAVNPRLIYASISGFGQDGPYQSRPGVDQIAQGMS